MAIDLTYDCSGIDWKRVSDILKSVGMAYYDAERHQKAFEASYCTVFLHEHGRLIGFGRALSDGSYQAAIYDCAVIDGYQGQGLGRKIVESLLSRLTDCNIILYASPGKEGFYEKQDFRKMKTGMARFLNREAMTDRGFTE
jgi:GNAT superfamily N-acetyltransferase